MSQMNIPKQTKRNTFFLTTLVLVISWGIGYLFLNYQFKESINDRFKNLHESTMKLFSVNNEHEKEYFSLQLENIVSLDGISEAVENNSTTELDNILSDYYVKLKKTIPDLKILTFRGVDNRTLYRAHKPSFYGDKLNKKRKLILDTSLLQKSLHGFEVGKLEMTYRITQAIFSHGKYVGNVEIGLDPTHFIKDLNQVFYNGNGCGY